MTVHRRLPGIASREAERGNEMNDVQKERIEDAIEKVLGEESSYRCLRDIHRENKNEESARCYEELRFAKRAQAAGMLKVLHMLGYETEKVFTIDGNPRFVIKNCSEGSMK